MASPYATKSELADYLGMELNDITEDHERMLKRASRFVDTQTRNNIDSDDESVAKQAVLEQVEWWIATGDELEQMQFFEDMNMEDFSFDGSNVPSIAPRAKRTLVLNGLLKRDVKRVGSTAY